MPEATSFELDPPEGDHSLPYNPQAHFAGNDFLPELATLEECPTDIRNIGWTLGNDCPYRCNHCYSMSARHKGQNLTHAIVDRVVDQLTLNGIETVNLGGNEPLFTNGLNPAETLLPYIIQRLHEKEMLVGLTTSGISALLLARNHPETFALLNDVDVSLDSPFEEEHNRNRGAQIYQNALKALEVCSAQGIDTSVIMCGMEWNFDLPHLRGLVQIARRYGAHVRINPIKTVEPRHLAMALSPETYYAGFSYLMQECDIVDLGEPPLAAMSELAAARGCPCGRTSFRIHAITPEGEIPVSPCVYLHDFKVGNLVTDELAEIVQRPQFQTFRRRIRNPEQIPGCAGCAMLSSCRGGCAARSYLFQVHRGGSRSLFAQDPYCPKKFLDRWAFPRNPPIQDVTLVHRDYLCTWIGSPRPKNSSITHDEIRSTFP